MKNAIIPLLIIGLLLSASFGLVAMNHMDGQGHNLCPFEAAGVTDCTRVQSPIDFTFSHLNSLAGFFLAVPVAGFVSLISLFLLSALTMVAILSEPGLIESKPSPLSNRIRKTFVSPQKTLLTDWFALHENSPAIVV